MVRDTSYRVQRSRSVRCQYPEPILLDLFTLNKSLMLVCSAYEPPGAADAGVGGTGSPCRVSLHLRTFSTTLKDVSDSRCVMHVTSSAYFKKF